MAGEFKKGVLEMAVLFTISRQKTYGYELIKEMSVYFPDTYEGTIYTVLRRLTQDRQVEAYEGATSGGPKRRYFKITPEGTRRLEELTAQWRTLLSAVRELGIE